MRPLAVGVLTSEFWLALAALAGKVTILLFTLNLIHSTDPDKVVQQITEVITAVGALFAISHGVTNYVTNRTNLKAAAVRAEAVKATTTQIIDRRAG